MIRIFKISAAFVFVGLFLGACSSAETEKADYSTPYPNQAAQSLNSINSDYWARDNFNLQAVGDVLRQSNSAEDFERKLNAPDGINNLDLNGDGYADYISVAEYTDRDTGYRGFSLFDRFGDGGNAIQEIATIILQRTLNGGDSRVYIDGNDQIYGNEYFYQGDWKDNALNIVNWAFQDRSDSYKSPYYYENYPDNYEAYRIVETPVYVTRVEQYTASPIFVRTNPAAIDYRARSPYDGRSYDRIYANLAEPNPAQKEFKKNNPKPPEFVPASRDKVKNVPPGQLKKAQEATRPERIEPAGEDARERNAPPDRADNPGRMEDPRPKKAKPEPPGRAKKNENQVRPNPQGNPDQKPGKGGGNNGGGKGNGKGNNGGGGGGGQGKGKGKG